MPFHRFVASFLRPLGQERLWITFLWALTLSVGLAGLDWTERWFHEEARTQTVVLLPRGTMDEDQRQGLRTKLEREPGVAATQWRSPAELTRQISGRFPQSEWQGLFPTDEAWLPWVLEVHPADPLESGELIRAFIARRQQEGAWRLTLWDPEPLQKLLRERALVRAVVGFWLLLAGLGGAVALLRVPWPARGGMVLVAWSALLGLLGPGAVWAAALLLAPPGLDPQTLGVALAAGFILATLAAPVLRLPKRKKSLSLSIKEDPDERAWQDPGPGK